MPRLICTLFLCFALCTIASPGDAARNGDLPPRGQTGLQILVMEVPDCIYCKVFRRDVAPTYQASRQATQIPMRFLDASEVDETALGLSSPVTMVPTVIVIRDNVEIGRIPGYVGPENFYRSIRYLLGKVGADNLMDEHQFRD